MRVLRGLKPIEDSLLGDVDSQLEEVAKVSNAIKQIKKQIGEVFSGSDSAMDFASMSGIDEQLVLLQKQQAFLAEQSRTSAIDFLNQEYDERAIEIKRLFGRESELLIDLEKERADSIMAIKAQEHAATANQLIGFGKNVATIMMKDGKEQFEIQKGLSIAGAVADGYASAISAYKAGVSVGGPFALATGAAYAAASLAATGAQIKQLSSTSYNSKSQNSSTGASGSLPSTPSQPLQQNVSITLEGESFSKGSVLNLVESINNEIQNGATINLQGV